MSTSSSNVCQSVKATTDRHKTIKGSSKTVSKDCQKTWNKASKGRQQTVNKKSKDSLHAHTHTNPWGQTGRRGARWNWQSNSNPTANNNNHYKNLYTDPIENALKIRYVVGGSWPLPRLPQCILNRFVTILKNLKTKAKRRTPEIAGQWSAEQLCLCFGPVLDR